MVAVSASQSPAPSYEELAALVAGLIARVEALEVENARLRAENAALNRKLGTDSSNSSTPPSQDSPAAKGKRRAQRSQRIRSKNREPGGQVGHQGSGLMPAVIPDRTETAPVPQDCSGCGADLADGTDAGMSWTRSGTPERSSWRRSTTGCRNGSAPAARKSRPRWCPSGRPGP